MDDSCETRYPILLVHGLANSAHCGRPFWGRIPVFLRAHGARVYVTNQDGWGGIVSNAAQVRHELNRVLQKEGCDRVNIIAHSKGGLESRYLISAFGMGRQVASLTMLSTPNHGADIARVIAALRPVVDVWGAAVNAYQRRLGDKTPAAHTVARELSPASIARFNLKNPDAACVYYQSFGAVLGKSRTDPFLTLSGHASYALHGPSDGMVSPRSARWGHFRGVLQNVSHQELVDGLSRDTPHFDILGFYQSLVSELAQAGF